MTDNELQMMSRHYRCVRRVVYEDATRPYSNDPELHRLNKGLLKKHVEKLSNDADLDNYRGTDKSTSTSLWHHLWTIIHRFPSCSQSSRRCSNLQFFPVLQVSLSPRGSRLIAGLMAGCPCVSSLFF